ncbi:MAG: hypothetical protein FJ117_02175 [Deltaproteobacteria bacterium]|nr:hypothetical protein [Deltaproteobacteria bacterium]
MTITTEGCGSSTRRVGETSEPCGEPQLINARWREETVKCGDEAGMLAETVNIPAGTDATFTLKRTSDNGTITSETSNTQPSSVTGTWISQKPSDTWNGAEVKFTAAAAGLRADSRDAQLSFHRYANIAQATISGRMASTNREGKNFGWDKKVHIEFTDRQMVLTVKVHFLNRTQPRPERGKKEEPADYRTRCEAVPIGGPVPEDVKQNIKNTIEGVYREQLHLHRHDCRRGNACNCNLRYQCCKFKVEVRAEFVETSGDMIHEVNLWPGSARANSNHWHRIESRPGKTWAHELGHLMGFYDEYPEGATGSPPWQPDVEDSLMGSGTDVYDYHLEEFRSWFCTQSSEQFDLKRNA